MDTVEIECTDRFGLTNDAAAGTLITVDTYRDPTGRMAGAIQIDERCGGCRPQGYLDEPALVRLLIAVAAALTEVRAQEREEVLEIIRKSE